MINRFFKFEIVKTWKENSPHAAPEISYKNFFPYVGGGCSFNFRGYCDK